MLKHLAVFLPLVIVGVGAEFVVLGRRDNPPPGFSLVGPTSGEEILSLRFALPSSDIPGLHETVYDISTPGSPRYGQYLTQEEVAQFVAPSAETVSQVNAWLGASNLTSSPITSAGDWVSVNMTVDQANALLAADFSTFQNDKTNQKIVRTLSYSIPSALKASVDWVHPTINFPETKTSSFPSFVNKTSSAAPRIPPAPTSVTVSPDCRTNSSWNPACLQQLYGIPTNPVNANPAANAVFGVSGFSNDFANKRDLKAFLEVYRPDMNPNRTFDFISIDGGINNQLPAGAGLDANPNTQYATALTNGDVHVTFISTGTLPNDPLTELLDQANYLASLKNPPQTILNTVTGLESEVSAQMATSICNAYAQLAARGVSYIVQTGIWGAGGIPFLPDCKPFDPPFPATCPFVTAVGATQFETEDTAETASEFSGGGFSSFFTRPRYQDAAVSTYLKATNNTHNAAFNVSGRAVPDVSAIQFLDWILDNQIIDFLESTSASAAIFSSMVALLTNERIAAGKPGIGFINPLLYANPGAFNDMKTGNNPGCNTPGFNSSSGWDPVTGFGSPSFPRLQQVCRSL
ncbi:Serine protease S53 [Mycena venus]|uniref:Serine protease S53 n=1 Tax=Mycena venus TaxID=2733690 RepID=A0A8H6XIL4_9AGAR|nr:Serine protease S53 [Mycena venus]